MSKLQKCQNFSPGSSEVHCTSPKYKERPSRPVKYEEVLKQRGKRRETDPARKEPGAKRNRREREPAPQKLLAAKSRRNLAQKENFWSRKVREPADSSVNSKNPTERRMRTSSKEKSNDSEKTAEVKVEIDFLKDFQTVKQLRG